MVLRALAVARDGTVRMRDALSRMPVGCHPLIFYQRVRPFLSGWKANPTLPDGVLYEVCACALACACACALILLHNTRTLKQSLAAV